MSTVSSNGSVALANHRASSQRPYDSKYRQASAPLPIRHKSWTPIRKSKCVDFKSENLAKNSRLLKNLKLRSIDDENGLSERTKKSMKQANLLFSPSHILPLAMKLVATSFMVLCAEPVSIWIAASKHALKIN